MVRIDQKEKALFTIFYIPAQVTVLPRRILKASIQGLPSTSVMQPWSGFGNRVHMILNERKMKRTPKQKMCRLKMCLLMRSPSAVTPNTKRMIVTNIIP